MVVLPPNFILLVCAAIVGSIVGFIIYGLIVGFENTLQEPGASDLERGSARSENDNAARLSELEKAGMGSGARIDWKKIAERYEKILMEAARSKHRSGKRPPLLWNSRTIAVFRHHHHRSAKS